MFLGRNSRQLPDSDTLELDGIPVTACMIVQTKFLSDASDLIASLTGYYVLERCDTVDAATTTYARLRLLSLLFWYTAWQPRF